MRYFSISLTAMLCMLYLGLGVATAQFPHPHPHPQPEPQPQPTPAPAPSQRLPVTAPGADINAKPGVPTAILDTLRRPLPPAKVNLPAPGSRLSDFLPPRELTAEKRQALGAELDNLRLWYKREETKLRQQWLQTVALPSAPLEATRQELLSQLQLLQREWASLKPLARQRPAQLRNLRDRLTTLAAQVKTWEDSRQRQIAALNHKFTVLTASYLTKQQDLIHKHFEPDNLSGAPTEDFALIYYH